jgi:hypothetical protein
MTSLGVLVMPEKKSAKEVVKESGFYEPYSHFSRTLKAWLVAYGIGAPVLLASQEHLSKLVIDSGCGVVISALFLLGVASQIAASLVYKYSMGIIYFSELDSEIKDTRIFKIADRVSESFGLELAFDLLTVICYAVGTYMTFKAILD